MRISDWSSDVCSSDLRVADGHRTRRPTGDRQPSAKLGGQGILPRFHARDRARRVRRFHPRRYGRAVRRSGRSEEHTSELQSLMRITYAGFRLQIKTTHIFKNSHTLILTDYASSITTKLLNQ